MPKAGEPQAPEATGTVAVSLLGDMGRRVMHNVVMYAMGKSADPDIAPALSNGPRGGVQIVVDRQSYEAVLPER